MTTQLVGHETRLTYPELGMPQPTQPVEGDDYMRYNSNPGQLWERLADATLNQDALTGPQWSRMAVARNQLGSRRSGLDWDVIGPLAFSDNRGYNDGYSIQASGTVQYGILAYITLTRRPNNTSGE